jgi:arylsulfatase A-like enzyme
LRSGYDEFFGPMAGGVDYFTHCASNGAHDLWMGEEEAPHEGYLTDLISKRSVDFIHRMQQGDRKDDPFFLSMHYTAPHWPWETREDHALASEIKDNIFHLQGGNIHTYHRMIHHMDEGIGWVVQALRETGQLDNTLIVFTSDNGGERFSDNWPLVGGKMDLTEGGIRVPWIAHWPEGIAPGGVSHQHCMTMDWSATILDIAGAKPDPDYPWDGQSLAHVLREPAHTFERPMYWRMNHRGQRAMRVGDWKYLRVDGNDYLFNIPADARERANLGGRQPTQLQALRERWESWNASMPPIPQDATVSLGYSVKDMPQR